MIEAIIQVASPVPPDPVPILLKRLDPLFRRHRDPERARAASAYMRNQFPFYGIAAPVQTRIAREAMQGLAEPTEAQLATLALACWRKPEREWQYFACGYLRRHIRGCSPDFIDTVEKLITGQLRPADRKTADRAIAKTPWWDTVDSLAAHTTGVLVAEHPELAATMDKWVRSENIWIARTAILHQLGYKSRTDAGRLFAYCLARARETEFFIRKAIGWALREYSKTDERAVRAFVRDHADVLSPLSRTEALKWLNRRAARGL